MQELLKNYFSTVFRHFHGHFLYFSPIVIYLIVSCHLIYISKRQDIVYYRHIKEMYKTNQTTAASKIILQSFIIYR